MRLTELPTTPDGLPVDVRTSLPKQFMGSDGLPMSGRGVVEMMQMERLMEAITNKPKCTREGRPTEAIQTPIAALRSAASTVLDFDISPRRRDDWDLNARKRTPDFDINPRKRN